MAIGEFCYFIEGLYPDLMWTSLPNMTVPDDFWATQKVFEATAGELGTYVASARVAIGRVP